MTKMMDPSMTLFGKTFQVNCEVEDSPSCNNKESCFQELLEDELDIKESSMKNDEQDVSSDEAMDDSTIAPGMSETTDMTDKPLDSETNQDEKEPNDAKKELKKPDKILPCPRCKSMDTKFCYYNNYNVNQPRHFCKKCQRYWTAGGTMRNVPVGAGRRKNKSSSSRYSHLTVPEALANGVHHAGLKPNGTVLSFGPDNPFCDVRGVEILDDRSSGSTVTSNSVEDQSKKGVQDPNQNFNGFANQMQCFPWPYMWNPAVPYYPSAFPMPVYPPHPYWNGASFPCNVPWIPTQKAQEANPDPSILGKHAREGEVISPSENDRSSRTSATSTVLIPKTLRIDDPDEAAKSSIWTTLGIKKDKGDPLRKGFFGSFQSKGIEQKDGEVEAPPALFKANPVALCRSFTFQERA